MMLGAHEIRRRGLVTPLLEKYEHTLTGMTGGLLQASYLLALEDDVLLDPNGTGGANQLASTREVVAVPYDLVATVSTSEDWAVRGVQVIGYHLEPGVRCHVPLALINHSPGMVRIYAGTPVARVTFEEVYDRRVVVNRFYAGRDKVYDTRTMANNETITELGT